MSQESKELAKKVGPLAAMGVLMALLLLPICLHDFAYGTLCDESAYGPMPPVGVESYADLTGGPYTVTFTPLQKHFKGFSVALANQPEGNKGDLVLTVYDEAGAPVDRTEAPLSAIAQNQWYRVYLHKELEQGAAYTLTIAAEECATYPWLQQAPPGCLAPETLTGGVLLGYCYADMSFSLAVKAAAVFLFVLIGCFAASERLLPTEKKLRLRRAYACLLLGLLLAANYAFYLMDSHEAIGYLFDQRSEKLVTGSVAAYRSGLAGFGGFGLGDLVDGAFHPYTSNAGLQGHVFRLLGGLGGQRVLRLFCAVGAAAVFMALVLLLRQKYNALLAGCFYVVFWLSPWVVNFAGNLYWVEFTWFLPMVVGLLCAWKIDEKKYRWACYGGAFLTVLVKCLCGYEYVTAAMMGLIAFPLADLAAALGQRDKKRTKRLLLATFLLGACALAGFAAALLIHGYLKGGGSLGEGLRLILEQDVLRRTTGGDMAQFEAAYWSSFNASIAETLYKYLQFDTQIITGVPGNLFPLLALLPAVLFVVDWHHARLDLRDLTLYVATALAAVSWIVLAKSHSYIHTHLNFVLWYFGFIQVCFYVILDKLVSKINTNRQKTGKGTHT